MYVCAFCCDQRRFMSTSEPTEEDFAGEVLLRSFSTRAPLSIHMVNINPSLDLSVVVDNGQRYYAYGMLDYKIIDEKLIDMDGRFKYYILVEKIGYLSMRTLMPKAADHELSHNELLNLTIDSLEGVKQDLEVALYLIGTDFVDLKIHWMPFMPLTSLDEENDQLKFLGDNSDGTARGLAFLFMSVMQFGGIQVVDLCIAQRYIHAYNQVAHLVAKQYHVTKGQSMTVNQHTTVLDPNILSECSRYGLSHFVAIGVVKFERMKALSKNHPLHYYDSIVAELTYAVINSLMKPAYSGSSTNAKLTRKTIEHKEELRQHLTEALELLGFKLLDFNFGWEIFPLLHFGFELDGYYEPVALQLHAEEAKQLIDAARGRCNNLWEITFEAFLDQLTGLWQPETPEGDYIKLILELALKAALTYRKKVRRDELEKLEAADSGLDPSHIYTVMTRAVRTRRDAVAALKFYNRDMVATILKLTGRDR